MAENDTLDYRLLFESVPDQYMVLTPDLHIATVSDEYARATKIQRSQVVGRHLFDVFPDNPDDETASGVSNLSASLQRVLTSREPDWMPLQKYDIRRPDSEGGGFEERYWSCLNSPVVDAQGVLRLITHRAEDVTEFVHLRQRGAEQDKEAQALRGEVARAEAEVYVRAEQVARAHEQLQARNTALYESETRLRRLAGELEVVNAEMTEKNQMLEESSRMKSEFLSNMSHELRTPLNAIIGFSELLKDGLVGPPLAQRQRDYMGFIFDGGQHLLALINDILDMSKVDAGKVDLQFDVVDVQAALVDGLRVVEEKANAKQLRLSGHIAMPMDDVMVDLRRFKQILYNLLSNAVKFTPQGGQVTLLAKRVSRHDAASTIPGFEVGRRTVLPSGDGDDFLEISVTDSGIGMRPQDLKQLFTPFTQINHPANCGIEGTGLGLAMVLRLVELHGGAVAVSSEPDRGTCFSVWLPWRQNAAKAAADSGTVEVAPGSRGLALVIEDDERASALMGLQLEELGFVVRHVRSAETALALIDELVPDLITLDIVLPGMDGWAFLRRVKSLQRWSQVPVVVVSVQPDGALAKSLGASLALQKPIRFDELQQGLTRLGLSPGAQDVTALVIDDNHQAVEVLTQPLQKMGCVVLRAYGGAEGVALARRFKPHLIMLDLEMPEFSGFQVVDELRSDPGSADIPIMIVTGRDLSERERAQLAGQGCQPLFPKGEDAGRFIGEVLRALAHVQGH